LAGFDPSTIGRFSDVDRGDQARFYGFVQQLGHDGVLEVGTDELLDEADAFGFAPKAYRQKTLEAYVGRLNHILDYIRWQQRSAEGR